jgi:hypothetical protein
MKCFKPFKILLVLPFFCIPVLLIAQELQTKAHQLVFIQKLAMEDAHYEHSLVFSRRDDEMDFWGDQKNYEQELKISDPQKYFAYIAAKKEAYEQQALYCDQQCKHGSYYQLRALYYRLYERPAYSLKTNIEEDATTPAGLLAIGPKKN